MRCECAAHHALLTNRTYKSVSWALQDATAEVARCFQRKLDTTEYLMILPSDTARTILGEHESRIAGAQRSTGGWKVKDTHRISLGYLKAYQHSGLLPEFLSLLRHDPYQLFADQPDIFGLLARERVFVRPNDNDGKLRKILRQAILDAQLPNGSWENSVLATALFAHQLLDLGLASGASPLREAAKFLFSCQMEDVERRSSNHGGILVAHHMFSNPDRAVEFHAAVRYRAEWIPRAACYRHLPMVQTGMAVKCLNAMGYEDDPRVLAACRNLVEIHEKYGGYCDSLIRNGIIAEERLRKGKQEQRNTKRIT